MKFNRHAGHRGTSLPGGTLRWSRHLTFGFNRTLWKDPRYGALNVMGQYEWLMRDPWAVPSGAPKATHDSTVYADCRYTVPGAGPAF